MNGHSNEALFGTLTAEEIAEIEAEEAYWLYMRQLEEKGDCDEREERTGKEG